MLVSERERKLEREMEEGVPTLTHSRQVQLTPGPGDCCGLSVAAGKSENLRIMKPLKHPSTKKSQRDRSRGKSSRRSFKNEVMDQQIWKDFPEDVLEAVIARLPIATFFRFRTVCQRWNSLLTSQSFSQHCAQVPQANPWFFTLINKLKGAMYDPSMKKWHHHTVSITRSKDFEPVASAGGLVCFLGCGDRNFAVYNPLTQSFKELPPRLVDSYIAVSVGMTVNGNSSGAGYKIIWVSSEGDYEIYDSLRKSWSRPGNMPASIKLPILRHSHAVSIDNTLYFLRSYPEGIVSYDMATGVWKQYIIPLPLHLNSHTLAECDGRIMLVGLLRKNEAKCACIWELQKMTLLWKEVDRMPNGWCLEFYGKGTTMACMGRKGLLMLSFMTRLTCRLFTYNTASREWLKVPGCVVPGERRPRWIRSGTAFHPCLTSVP